jgi:hypothetical protein
MRRIFSLIIINSTLVVLWAIILSPAAQAQRMELRLPDPVNSESGSRNQADFFQTRSASCSVGGACQQPNYWIISSRPCQNVSSLCSTCQFDYFRCCNKQCIRSPDSKEFQNWFQPDFPVCIVIHGSWTGFEALRQGSLDMYRWIRNAAPNRKLQVLFYTWPSEGPITLLPSIDIVILGRRSTFYGIFLTQLMAQIPGTSPIGLFGHSHGARTIASALHLQGGGMVQGHRLQYPDQSGRKIRAVFAAAAIDHHWLNPGERYGRALYRAEYVLNLRNRKDLILGFYPLRKPFSHRALARAGFTRSDRRRMGCWNHKIAELDVTYLVGRHHMWEHYYSCPEIAQAIVPYLFGSETSK